jgi:lipoyl(octanoyl) transferase
MEEAARARREGRGPDLLLLLEHPHVVTLGRNAERDHVLAAPAELTCLGVEVQDCDRGGDVTYHGPGQLVAWPVFQLPEGRHDVRAYVRDLEEAQIRALARFGIAAGREPGLPGVWVGRDKIGAVGVRISRWLTTHGLALNVAPDLAYFRLITPCGLRDRGVTSMERILGGAPAMDEVKAALARAFAAVFAGEEFPETR